MRTAQYITGAKLPAIQDLYTRQCQRKALKNVKDFSHASHRLFSLLPHAKFRSKRLLNSFYPQAIRLLNIKSNGYPDYLRPLFYAAATLCYYLCIVTLTLPTYTYYLNPRLTSTLTLYRYPLYITSTLTLYWYPLYITSLLLFYCCSLIICYFYFLLFNTS